MALFDRLLRRLISVLLYRVKFSRYYHLFYKLYVSQRLDIDLNSDTKEDSLLVSSFLYYPGLSPPPASTSIITVIFMRFIMHEFI